MGFYTPNAQVWYPATTDTAEINTLLSTMASSIEAGLEPRLAHQEIAVGIKAGVQAVTLTGTMTLLPMSVPSSAAGMFSQGLTISGGVITIQTAGMYLVSAGLSITNVASHSCKFEVRKNGSTILFDEVVSSASFFQFAKGSTALNCVAGDTIAMYGGDAGGTGSTVADYSYNHLTVVLVQALPL